MPKKIPLSLHECPVCKLVFKGYGEPGDKVACDCRSNTDRVTLKRIEQIPQGAVVVPAGDKTFLKSDEF